MKLKFILLIPLLICMELTAQKLTVDDLVYSHLGPVYRDAGSYSLPWGKHEGPLRGVPANYDWANGARPGAWMNHGSNQAVTGWGQVYEMGPNSPEKNVRVQLRNFKMYVFVNNQWTQVESASSNIQAGWYSEDFTSNSAGISSRDESSNGGGRSFGFKEGYNVHFWDPKWPRTTLPSGFQAFFIVVEARLIPGTDPSVDLSRAKYLLGVSADTYPTTTSHGFGPWPSLSISRHKWVTAEWQSYCSYISGSIPTTVEGYRAQIVSRPLPPDVAAKGIAITKPAKEDVFIAQAEIDFEVTTDAHQAEIKKVLYFANDILIGESGITPYSLSWKNVRTGDYNVQALMVDSENDSIYSKPAKVKVHASVPPMIGFIAPRESSVLPENQNLTLEVSSSDADGVVEKVIFYNGDVLIGESKITPFSFAWENVPMGNYMISARAVDNTGTSSALAEVNFTVGDCNTGSNLLSNAEFNAGMSGWRTWYAGGNTFSTSIVQGAGLSGDNCLHVNIAQASGMPGIRIYRRFNFTNNSSYRLCFTAKTETTKMIKIALKEKGLTATEYWSREIEIVPGETSYGPYIFNCTQDYNDGELIFYLGSNTSDIWLDRIIISDGLDHAPALPMVSITSPANGSTITLGSSDKLTVTADYDWGVIRKVELFSGEELLASTISRPYEFSLSNLPLGEHVLQAVATNDNLLTNTSEPITITVENLTTHNQLSQAVFLLYPNPTIKNSGVTVQQTWPSEDVKIEVYNPTGELVFSEFHVGQPVIHLPGSITSTSGIHVIKVISNSGVQFRKLLVY